MQVVWCRDKNGVGELGAVEEVFPGGDDVFGVEIVVASGVGAFVIDWIGNADDLKFIFELRLE